jgi:hypothetical protein
LKSKLEAAVSESQKRSLALCCSILSAVAVPILVYIALLCTSGSRLIEIPHHDKPRAALGAWIAAAMYAATFVFCSNYRSSRGRSQSEIQPLLARQ